MSDHPIVAFIEARYAEIEQDARRACEPSHHTHPTGDVTRWEVEPFDSEDPEAWPAATWVVDGHEEGVAQVNPRGAKPQHIARHDPAYVLADIAAKRAILAEHCDVNDGDCGTCIVAEWGYPTHGGSTIAPHPCKTVRLLAAPFASHPDYLAEWSVC